MNKIYWLSQITNTERPFIGDKFFLLSQLLQSELPIFSGLILDSNVFQEFIVNLDDDRSFLDRLSQSYLQLDIDDYSALQILAKTSRHKILQGIIDSKLKEKIELNLAKFESQWLIIRPSLVAHKLDKLYDSEFSKSYICYCESNQIIECIKQIWSVVFNAKSLFYWHKLGVDLQAIKVAILIQPSSNAIASGTVAINSSQAIVETSWGLDHSLQRGEVEPDRYLVNLENTTIISQNVGLKTRAYRLPKTIGKNNVAATIEPYLLPESDREKIVLKPTQITALIELIIKARKQQPQLNYFEWTFPDNQTDSLAPNFYLTQVGYGVSQTDSWSLEPKETTNKETTTIALSQPKTSEIIRGIAAASGIVTAEVIVCESLDSLNSPVAPGVIIVTAKIQPQQIPLIQNVAGIITEIGGKTSHGAIIARELGIPALVAATNATRILHTGQMVTLNSERGIVLSSREPSLVLSSDRKKRIQQYYLDTNTTDVPLGTQLMVSLSQPELIETATRLPIDGIGLLRSEFMLLKLLGKRSLPEWLAADYQAQFLDRLADTIAKFTTAFAPKPIYYRSLDFPSTKATESQSALGVRGTYSYLANSTCFQLELTALARVMAAQPSNLKLILPFVRSVEEWQFCRDLVVQSGLTRYPQFELWMMAEVPSIAYLLPEYIAAGVQGIAIGTNDLAQLLLGVDREEDFASQSFRENSVAIERAISQLIRIAKNHQLPCSICVSAHFQDNDWLDKLVRWGIDIIVVESHTAIETYRAIARIEKRILLEK